MWLKSLFSLLVKEVVVAVFKAVTAYLQRKRQEAAEKKQVKLKMKEIMDEKDPQVRAKRLADFLNS